MTSNLRFGFEWAVLTAAAFAFPAYAQAAPSPQFDSSGNSMLKGSYFARWVGVDQVNASTGAFARARSFTGIFAFDGAGHYSFSGQISDSTQSSGAAAFLNVAAGTYSLSSGGLLQMQNPADSTLSLHGGIGSDALVASSTEPGSSGNVAWDLLIAVTQTSSVANGSWKGNYLFAGFEYAGGSVSNVRDYAFLASADGNGNLGTMSVTGAAESLGNIQTVQLVQNADYNAASGAFTVNFPVPSGATAQTQLISGPKQIGLSADGQLMVGGALNGYDMIVGMAAPAGSGGNSAFQGTYYAGGLDYAAAPSANPPNYFDAYFGSIASNGAGTSLTHQRLNPSTASAYDFYFVDQFAINSSGSVALDLNLETFYLSANGQSGVLIGLQSPYSFEFWVAAQSLPASGAVYLNPLGIANVASYDPVTSPVAPGEFLILNGTNLAGAPAIASTLPLPTTLGTTSVTFNGVAAPLYYVSPTQIYLIVPFESPQTGVVQIVASNNGTASNPVTVYASDTSPGMFTAGANGIGPGSITHQDGSLVTEASPAQVGESVVLYASGLGPVTPSVADGAAAPSSQLAETVSPVRVFVGGVEAATVEFEGLAPGFTGLYQMDFVIPAGVNPGQWYCDLSTDGAYFAQALIAIGSPSHSSQPAGAARRSSEISGLRLLGSLAATIPHH
jgi:uncharacterized protein (TIGR03437 family)